MSLGAGTEPEPETAMKDLDVAWAKRAKGRSDKGALREGGRNSRGLVQWVFSRKREYLRND